jgi:beta-ribofuranosylaminobenzene 5'-phosphate synthase
MPDGTAEGGRQVHVVAPSRLHFGLLSFGHRSGRQYGGIGLMIDRPAVRLSLSGADQLTIGFAMPHESTTCLEAEFRRSLTVRVQEFVRRWAVFQGRPDPPSCRITIEAAPPQHAGLGTGTQLALSVAAGLNALYATGRTTAAELAISVGRGLRSAVGTYGFVQGGLIVERGKLAEEPIAPLDCRLELPCPWCVVLVQPAVASGLSGVAEQQAFDSLPPVPREVTRQLSDEIRLHTVPAAARSDFERFSESVYRYGRLAGQCFAPIQGGPYNGRHLEQLVQVIRSLGIRGVGQSSWGPTLFALLPDPAAAEHFQRRLSEQLPPPLPKMLTSPLNRHGAQVTVQPV